MRPAFVPRYQGHFLHGKPILEQAAGALVPQVVEVQIRNAQGIARGLEILAQRLRVHREDAALALGARLAVNDGQGIAQQRDPLIVPFLGARVFAVAHQHQLLSAIHIGML